MDNLKSRLLEFIEFKGLTKAKFERVVGLSNGFVDKSGDNIRKSIVDKIVDVYPDINRAWLLTGDGAMLKQDQNVGASLYIKGSNNVQVNDSFVSSPERVNELEDMRIRIAELEARLEERNMFIDCLKKIIEAYHILNKEYNKNSDK